VQQYRGGVERENADALPGDHQRGALTKTGAGTLVLNKANTYSGCHTLGAGALRMGVPDALVSNTALSVNGGALDLNGMP